MKHLWRAFLGLPPELHLLLGSYLIFYALLELERMNRAVRHRIASGDKWLSSKRAIEAGIRADMDRHPVEVPDYIGPNGTVVKETQ